MACPPSLSFTFTNSNTSTPLTPTTTDGPGGAGLLSRLHEVVHKLEAVIKQALEGLTHQQMQQQRDQRGGAFGAPAADGFGAPLPAAGNTMGGVATPAAAPSSPAVGFGTPMQSQVKPSEGSRGCRIGAPAAMTDGHTCTCPPAVPMPMIEEYPRAGIHTRNFRHLVAGVSSERLCSRTLIMSTCPYR